MKTFQLFPVGVLTIMAIGTLSTNAQATGSCSLPGTCGTTMVGLEGVDHTANGVGAWGIATGSGGNAVLGLFSSATVDSTYSNSGVYGASDTNNGVIGTTSTSSGSGVAGINTTITGNAIGVYGYTANRTGGYAVYADGNLQVTKTPYCSGCTAFTNNSDIRLKKDVKPLTGALETLLRLQGVTFEWTDPHEHGEHTGMQRGFIAQDVEKVVPDWVGVDSRGFKTLNLTGLEPIVVESLKTLKADNDALHAKETELEHRMKALESNRRPVVSLNANGLSIGLAGIALAGALIVGRRKQSQERS